jgi:hypothetical protein
VGSVVYLLRSPRERISPCLYPKTNDITVISVEKTPLVAKVLESVPGCSKKKGTTLSYSQLLELLMESHRVITL